MRKIVLSLFLFAFCSTLFGQNTTTAITTLSDSNSVVWANASLQFNLQNPGGGPVTYSGTGLPVTTSVSGTTNSVGTSSTVLASVDQIQPAGTCWILTITPQATSGPQTLGCISITGGSQDITTFVRNGIIPPSFKCNHVCNGYNTNEVQTPIVIGSVFFQTPANSCTQYNGSSWQSCGSSGSNVTFGSGAPVGACTNGSIYFNTASSYAQYACNGTTWFASGSGGLPAAPFAFQTLLALTPGTTYTPTSYGADMTTVNGGIIDSDGSRSTEPGITFYGDSKTQSSTTGVAFNQGYAYLTNLEINQGAYNNFAVGGDACADTIFRVLTHERPPDAGSPIYSVYCGTNDANFYPVTTPAQIAFLQYVIGANAWLETPASAMVYANSVGAATAALPISGGSSFAVGDTATFTCPTTNAVFQVLPPQVSTAATVLGLVTPGSGCVTTASVAPSATSGSGTGMTATLLAQETMTQSGTWGADSTFTANPGLVTTTNGSTLTYSCPVDNTGVLMVWAYAFTAANTSTWSLAVDGITQTESITTLQNVPSLVGSNPPRNIGGTTAIGAAYVGLTEGAHSCVITAHISGGGQVGILGGSIAMASRVRGSSGPNSYLWGVDPQQNNANSTVTAAYNSFALFASNFLTSAGRESHFIDIRSAVDPVNDYNASGNCPASLVPGLHGNTCWHRKAANLLEHAIKSGSPSTTNFTPPSLAAINRIFNGTSLPSLNWVNEWCDFGLSGTHAYSCDNILNMNLTSTFGVAANSFSHIHIAPASANSWAIQSFCFYNATSASPLYPGDQTTKVVCPYQFYDTTLVLDTASAKLLAGSTSTNSVSLTFRSQVNATAGPTWTADDFTIQNVPAAAGLNPEVDLIIKNSVATGTGLHCIIIGGTAAGYKFCPSTLTTAVALTLSIPGGTPTIAATGTGVTSMVCASTYTCTNTRGRVTIVGGTGTTGTIGTITFSGALSAAPWCSFTEMGSTSLHGIDHLLPSTTVLTLTAASTVNAATINVDYECQP